MLIGRQVERERLRAAVAGAVAGRSRAVVIVGEPGVGKTALLDDAVASADGLRVVRATGYEAETHLAFAGLASILSGFHDLIPGLPAPQAAALSGALGVGPPLPPGDRFTAYVATLNLLAAAADAAPLVVAVDDAHWLDAASLDALAFAARRLAAEGIVMLLAARHEPPAMRERTEGIEVLEVLGLEGDPARELVRRTADADVSDPVATRLVDLAAGNPLALTEAAQALSPDQLAGRSPLPELLPVGETLARAFMARAERLPDATRRALLIAAAGAGDPGLVREALSQQGLGDALRVAESAGLVDLGPDGVRFRHPLIRTGIYRSADAAHRRETHTLLGRVAGARGAAAIHAAAHHRAEAAEGPDEEAAAALHSAGRHAASRLGYAEAAALISRAADLSTSSDTRAPRLLEAGSLAMMAGRPAAAVRDLDRALAEASDPQILAAAEATRARVEMWTGEVHRAHGMLTTLASRMAASAPDEAAKMYADAALCSAMGGRGEGMRAAATAACRLASEPASLAVVVGVAAVTDIVTGAPDAYAAITAIDDPLRGLSSDDPLDYGRMGFVVTAYVWAGLHGVALDLTARLEANARALSAPSMLPIALLGITGLHVATGNWDAVVVTGLSSLQLAQETGQRGVAAWGRCMLAHVHAARGEDAAVEHAHAALEDRQSADSVILYAQATLGLLALGRGDLADAIRWLTSTLDGHRRAGMGSHVVLPYLPDLVETAVRADRRPLALEALHFLETLDPSGIPQTMAAVARCRGLLDDDHLTAAEHFRTAVALEDGAGLPFEAARSRLLLGERLLRTRNRSSALEPLERAFAAFDHLGAAPWADRAADALGAIRARPSRSHLPTADLTAQELQVAHAAARGLTNKQIAAQLFLSVKTVEFHLRNAYGKLGVRSRTQLTLKLRHGPQATGGDPG